MATGYKIYNRRSSKHSSDWKLKSNERANIFKPYVTMRPKGVGLGLAIVHQIASAHHWEVTCDANVPHGALFRFSRLILTVPAA